jgi:hypothetical protein
MKLLLKLAITALLANAAFRLGTEYLAHYRFRDSVREAARYRANSDDELRQRVLETATSYDIPLKEDDFTIQRDSGQALIRGSYTKPIELVPGFPYAWHFDFEIEAIVSDVPLIPGAPLPKSVHPPSQGQLSWPRLPASPPS